MTCVMGETIHKNSFLLGFAEGIMNESGTGSFWFAANSAQNPTICHHHQSSLMPCTEEISLHSLLPYALGTTFAFPLLLLLPQFMFLSFHRLPKPMQDEAAKPQEMGVAWLKANKIM